MNRYELKVLKNLCKDLNLLPNDKIFQLLEWLPKRKLTENVPFNKIELKNFIKIYYQFKWYSNSLINFDFYEKACKHQDTYINLVEHTDFYEQLFKNRKKIIQKIFDKIIKKINELILYKKMHQETIESLNQIIQKYRSAYHYEKNNKN